MGNNDVELLICGLFWWWLVDCIHADLCSLEMAESDHHWDVKVAHCGIGYTGRHHIRVQRHVDCRVLNEKFAIRSTRIPYKQIIWFYSYAVIYIKLTSSGLFFVWKWGKYIKSVCYRKEIFFGIKLELNTRPGFIVWEKAFNCWR